MWSLGITLVELAIGRFPFTSASSTPSLSESQVDSSDSDRERDSFGGDDATLNGAKTLNGASTLFDEGEETLSPVRPGRKEESLEAAQKRRSEKRASRMVGSGGMGSSGLEEGMMGVSLSGSSHQMSILELLQYIVNEPSPSLPPYHRVRSLPSPTAAPASTDKPARVTFMRVKFSEEVKDFVKRCLRKEPIGWDVRRKGELAEDVRRPVPRELLVRSPSLLFPTPIVPLPTLTGDTGTSLASQGGGRKGRRRRLGCYDPLARLSTQLEEDEKHQQRIYMARQRAHFWLYWAVETCTRQGTTRGLRWFYCKSISHTTTMLR